MPPFDRRFILLCVVLIFTVSQLYLAPKLIDNTGGLDFRLIWLAGNLWIDGVSPYSDQFAKLYFQEFGQGPISHFWVYPPSFHPLAGAVSRLNFHLATQVWNIFNFLLLHIASFIISSTFSRTNRQCQLQVYLLTAATASLMQATAVALAIGQTSFIVYLAIALLIFGFGGGFMSKTAVSVALLLAGLKPGIGIILFFAAAARPEFRPSCMIAFISHVMLITVSAAMTGFSNDFTGFWQAVSKYSSEGGPANAPQNLVGATQIASMLGFSINGNFLMLIACIAAILVAKRAINPSGFAISIICVIGLLAAPLHTYDLTFTAMLLVLSLNAQNWLISMSMLTGFAAIFRSDNAANILGIINPAGEIFPGSLISTIGFIIVTVAAFTYNFKPPNAAALPQRGRVPKD